ncbi:hypothetical protein T484DRAFT_1641598 [Baffinella frigidus]|nr:hypothetical protein T484DRAFT_1641598 [Cryptophyta sp. CCMP2293]
MHPAVLPTFPAAPTAPPLPPLLPPRPSLTPLFLAFPVPLSRRAGPTHLILPRDAPAPESPAALLRSGPLELRAAPCPMHRVSLPHPPPYRKIPSRVPPPARPPLPLPPGAYQSPSTPTPTWEPPPINTYLYIPNPQPSTLHPKPQTLLPNLPTPNPNPQTPNTKS